ncbi:MAG: transglycosylase SLT domain-containing protein [Sandaracinaceae bacterium]
MPVLRASSLMFALAALATCNGPRNAATPPTAQPEAEAETPASTETAEQRFDPDVVRPAEDSAVGAIRVALDRGDAPGAAATAAQALAHGRETEVERIYWLAAHAHQQNGEPVRAYQLLGNVADAEHPLAPWATLTRAQMRVSVDAAGAAEEVAPLVEMDWAGRSQARDLYAAALVEAGDVETAEPLLRTLLAEAPEDSAAAALAMPLAELLASSEDEARKIEALALFRRVAMHAPLSSSGREAAERADAVLSELSRAERRARAEPTPEEALARAEALAAAMRHADAETAFHEVAARAEDDELECRARYGEGRAIYYRRQRRRAAEHLSAVARECEAPEVRAWARYLSGRGFTSAGERELAVEQYTLLEREVSEHSLADDARYRAALIAFDAGDETTMVSKLESLPEAYPEGDMRGRARFMLAWRARRAGDLEEALRQLDATLAEGPMEDREDLGGRAAYWRAAILADLDRSDDAVAGFRSVATEFPLRYYGQQAMQRLGEMDAAAADEVRVTLGAPGDPAITFAWRDEMDSPAFRRAVELFAVGAVDQARTEMSAVRGEDGDDELRWVEAALLDRASAHDRAVYVTRRLLSEFMEQPPRGDHYARWRIAYPQAFADEITRAASSQPIPPELIFGIAREESSFRPGVRSIAQAYGLTQLILPTAERFGRRVGIRATPSNLTDPETNVRIGAAYMGWLWERYEDNPVVLVSAYNAGQGAVDRWLRERGTQRLDEWVEDIPYDETRRYTRRVLQSWGIYAWLGRGELPPLRPELPQR